MLNELLVVLDSRLRGNDNVRTLLEKLEIGNF